MAAFHVFVEGATDPTPAGASRLAEAIGKHYGLPAADLAARLAKGRFRVKGNTDRATAEQYKRDLERLGARCTIEEATAENSQRATPIPFPAVRPGTPPPIAQTPPTGTKLPASASGSKPLPASASAASAPKPGTAAAKPGAAASAQKPAGPYQSGLSAAFSGDSAAASLGALEGDGFALSLASVDGGAEPNAQPAGSFEPPGGGLSASIGPAPEKPAKPAKPARPKDEPLDMFAPPDAQGDEFKVDIADDEVAFTAKKRASTPIPIDDGKPTSQEIARDPAARKSQPSLQPPARESQPLPVGRASQPAITPPQGAAVGKAGKLGPLADPRARFVAGVVLALGLGFVPAHFVAAMRESSTYEPIDKKVIAAQQLADTPDAYATLDRLRADQLARKEGERRNAAIIGIAVWALVAAGIAFVWFKKVPWEDLE